MAAVASVARASRQPGPQPEAGATTVYPCVTAWHKTTRYRERDIRCGRVPLPEIYFFMSEAFRAAAYTDETEARGLGRCQVEVDWTAVLPAQTLGSRRQYSVPATIQRRLVPSPYKDSSLVHEPAPEPQLFDPR